MINFFYFSFCVQLSHLFSSKSDFGFVFFFFFFFNNNNTQHTQVAPQTVGRPFNRIILVDMMIMWREWCTWFLLKNEYVAKTKHTHKTPINNLPMRVCLFFGFSLNFFPCSVPKYSEFNGRKIKHVNWFFLLSSEFVFGYSIKSIIGVNNILLVTDSQSTFKSTNKTR